MKTIPFVHEGLGNSSYVVDLGDGKAIVIDPDRSVDRYVETMTALGLQAVGVFETHLHADFVSGARELNYHTGAPIFLPAGAEAKFGHNAVKKDEVIALEGSEVSVVASPGHTPEHSSYVVRTAGGPPVLFSGGSLIVGGAARTDLISRAMTEPLTRAQFHTLREAFTKLPDETLLFPTHGGGSFCSTGAGGERASTLGRERATNPLLGIGDEEEFVSWFPTTFPAVPDYFYRMRAVNQQGPRLRREIDMPRALDAAEFAERRRSAVVVDARSMGAYAEGHIPGSLNNTLRDAYAVWLGWLVREDAELLFVAEDDADIPALVQESMLVGFERFGGWLHGGVSAWEASGRPIARIDLVEAQAAKRHLMDGAAALDVREQSEYDAGHLPGALHVPLGRLDEELARVPADRPLVVYCGHGERSSSAISLLEAAGRRDLINLEGGIGAWEGAGFEVAR
jgi:glyoxylase-like metal-dependent hydrolase (beta-lactamase superfamily II)